jgi:hypothetical protein
VPLTRWCMQETTGRPRHSALVPVLDKQVLVLVLVLVHLLGRPCSSVGCARRYSELPTNFSLGTLASAAQSREHEPRCGASVAQSRRKAPRWRASVAPSRGKAPQ